MLIIPIKYAESTLPESAVFINGDKDKTYPIAFIVYLIKTSGRTILVDAGCETLPGFDMKNFIKVPEALRMAGVGADDITDVIITHAHRDHIECVHYFDRAVIHIQRAEYEAGKHYIPDGFTVNIFDDDYTVCDGVKIIKIGGHTDGSCVVEITQGDKINVIVGDECYSRRCLTEKIRTGEPKNPDKSMAFIERYSTDDYIPLLCHEE